MRTTSKEKTSHFWENLPQGVLRCNGVFWRFLHARVSASQRLNAHFSKFVVETHYGKEKNTKFSNMFVRGKRGTWGLAPGDRRGTVRFDVSGIGVLMALSTDRCSVSKSWELLPYSAFFSRLLSESKLPSLIHFSSLCSQLCMSREPFGPSFLYDSLLLATEAFCPCCQRQHL